MVLEDRCMNMFFLKIDFGGNSPTKTYNITNCCKAASVLPQCLPLCTYDIKVSDLQLLGQACSLQMGNVFHLS